jgi:hypothetical protein
MIPRTSPAAEKEAFEEKSFYLDEFRRQTLLIAVPADAITKAEEAQPLVEAVTDLSSNATRLLLL